MKNKYFLIINSLLFTIFSIILFACNSAFNNSFWIPYVFLIVAFVSSSAIISYDLIMEKQRLSKDFGKQIVASGYLGIVELANIFYLVIKTNNLAWLIVPNIIIILAFVVLLILTSQYSLFNAKQDDELHSSHQFSERITSIINDVYSRETNYELKTKLFNLKNIAKYMIPSNDTSLGNIENEIEENCLKLSSLTTEEKDELIDDINALITKRDNLIKGTRR